MLYIKSLAARWLLLCCLLPLRIYAENEEWRPYEIHDTMDHRHRPLSIKAFIEKSSTRIPPMESYPENFINDLREETTTTYDSSNDRNEIEAHLQQLDPNEEEIWKSKEIAEKMDMLDRILSEDPNDSDKNTIEDKMIPEETKRVVRQVRKQRPGFFWTLARVAFETYNDTKSAIQQIGEIVGSNFGPDPTIPPVTGNSLINNKIPTTTASSDGQTATTAEKGETMPTTTEGPYKLTRIGVQTLVRRNLLGLIRLFNIEWQDALNQSDVNVKEFRKDLSNQIGTYLQDNPEAY